MHLARDTQGGTAVAIKIMRPELAQSRATDRFLKEIRRTATLDHPHILKVLDSGEVDGRPYFVLPYMEGGTLRMKLQRESQLPFDETIAILRTVADALDYAHAQGLIHRDVKPENILFTGGKACLGDFGIARVLETVYGTDGSTSSDTIRGTYAYMSPEQAAGNKNLDGRSDIYALACVTYEMIAGMPAFIGPTPEAVVSQRFVHAPRELRVYRQSATPAIDVALAKAFAMSPADRYRTATEFVDALDVAIQQRTHTSDGMKKPTKPRWRMGAVMAVSLAAAVVVAVVASTSTPPPPDLAIDSTAVETTHVVVLPFEHDAPAPSLWRDEDLLRQGFARWRDIVLIDQFQVADALRRFGRIQTSEDAARVAASLGAGRYVRGRVSTFGTDWRASASLYDTRTSAPLYQQSVRVPRHIEGAAAAYARLADSLLLRGASADSLPLAETGTRSLPAVQAFSKALTALEAWNLALAERALDSALYFDSNYARASLWLAQVRAWQGHDRNDWGTLAERALNISAPLQDRERELARALSHLFRGTYADACAAYEGLIRRNDRDFAAWFGLGQCEMTNKVVVRDAASPSGYRFRSNAQRGMRAYSRAFEILPSVYRGYQRDGFQPLQELLLVSKNLLVTGIADTGKARFRARPGWIGDSLVLVPYEQAVMIRDGPTPPGMETAIRHQRTEFRRIAAAWSGAFPRLAGAKEAVAISLELLADSSAIDTLQVARRLATTAADSIRLGARQVLLLVKFGIPGRPDMLEKAASLGDSLLSGRRATADDARLLAPVAVLLGRCDVADSLIAQGGPGDSLLGFSGGLYSQAQARLMRATLGCEVERTPSVAAIAAMIDREAKLQHADVGFADHHFLLRPAMAAAPYDIGVLRRLARSANNPLAVATLNAGTGDIRAARAVLERVERDWVKEPGTPDFMLIAARVRLLIGDTAQATRHLEEMLNGVRAHDPGVLDDVGNAAAFVAGAALRAQIAMKRRDVAATRQWAAIPGALWGRADPRLRTLANQLSK